MKEFRAETKKKEVRKASATPAENGKISSIINKFKNTAKQINKTNPESVKASGEKF